MIGFGAGPVGALPKNDGVALVRAAFERGITVFDTAPSYGGSEEILGAAFARDRHRVALITKGGYGVTGVGDWTPEVITRGIERALRALSTDYLDAYVLHSCPEETLLGGGLIEPLVRAREAGKVRAIGYSGDGDALAVAAWTREFDVLECSVNVLDREALGTIKNRGKRVLAKRVLANAPWSPHADRSRPDVAEYMRRYEALAPSMPGIPDAELFARFAAFAPGVDVALVGTTKLANLEAVLAAVAKGPLPADVLAALDAKWAGQRPAWSGLI